MRGEWIDSRDMLPTRDTRYAGPKGVKVLYYERHGKMPRVIHFDFKSKKFKRCRCTCKGRKGGFEWYNFNGYNGIILWKPLPSRPDKEVLQECGLE